jgi:hypothetical protein
MNDAVSRKALIDCLKKEAELCIKEKFNENKTRFYLGRETALTDIIRQIESGRFDTLSAPEGKIESLKAIIDGLANERHDLINEVDALKDKIFEQKAITELAVKGLKEIACLNVDSDYSAGTIARNTFSEIERLQNDQNS